MKGLQLTREQAEAHQRKHGFLPNKNAITMPQLSAPRRGKMNSTESEYSLILEAMKRKGEILRYEFEGMTLRWADMRYTPDFVVFVPDFGHESENPHPFIKLIEVKGGWTKGKFERAVERFRHAKTYYGDVFQFELHQKTKNGWIRKF